ncbi:sigma-70 family RNA polymerase sigma factor [Bradyrhizobium sp. USDA 4369]
MTLTVVDGKSSDKQDRLRPRELDWSILMARAQDGDRDAYHRLLTDISPYLRSLAARWNRQGVDIEDAVQDILLTIHTIRHTYDPARPFAPWLVTIARRRLIDRLRRQGHTRRREVVLEREHESVVEPQPDTGHDGHILRAAVDSLPPAQQQALRLVKLQEMSLNDASKVSGMSVNALKVNIHRALKNLQKLFSDRDLP